MSRRSEVMCNFEKYRDYTAERVESGIELNRKGYGYITLKDSDGNSIENAKITLKQANHEFKFGANIFMLKQFDSDEKNAEYERLFVNAAFNMATLPFYWKDLELEQGKPRFDKDSVNVYRRPAVDLCMEFCEKNGIEPREHALAYDAFYPDWVVNADPREAKRLLDIRMQQIAERYADKIPTIEVTNEVTWNNGSRFHTEPDYVTWCLKAAEKHFPNNELVVNEWTGIWQDRLRDWSRYHLIIEKAMRDGARVDAIGMQYHMFYSRETEAKDTELFYDPKNLYYIMDSYANFGLPMQITEVTIPAYSNDAEDEELQADIIEQLYSIWFSYPNMEQIIYWNLIDGYAAYAPLGDMTAGENKFFGGLLRFDMSPKPAYFRIKELIEKRWHTEAEVNTDLNGNACFKGFYGEYDVEIELDGKYESRRINLSKGADNQFEIIL